MDKTAGCTRSAFANGGDEVTRGGRPQYLLGNCVGAGPLRTVLTSESKYLGKGCFPAKLNQVFHRGVRRRSVEDNRELLTECVLSLPEALLDSGDYRPMTSDSAKALLQFIKRIRK